MPTASGVQHQVVGVAALRPHPQNYNRHDDGQIADLRASLREFGQVRSIVVQATDDGSQESGYLIVAGHGLVLAARAEGLAELRADVIPASWPRAKVLAYLAADNELARRGNPDEAQLAALVAQVAQEATAGLAALAAGSAARMAELLKVAQAGAAGEDPGPQVDKAAELQEKWQVKTGDMFALGDHRLVCGDCTDKAIVERVMGGEKAGAVVTDPPYGQNQAGVTNDAPEQLQEIISGAVTSLPIDNAVVVAFSSPRTFPTWLDATRATGHKFERMLWMYKAAQETFPWRGWLLKSEAILVTSVGVGQWQDVHPYSHDCYYKSEVSGELAADLGWHGSVKPLDVVQDLINRVSTPGTIVFDPFLGSGTTLIACEKLGRRCRAIEIEPKYVAVCLERFYQMSGNCPLAVEGRGDG